MSQWLNTKIKSKLDDCRSGASSTKVSCKSTELKHRVVTYRHAETEMSLCRIKQRHHTVGGPATDQNIQCGHIKDCKLSTTTGGNSLQRGLNVPNFLSGAISPVQELLKLIYICQIYRRNKSDSTF